MRHGKAFLSQHTHILDEEVSRQMVKAVLQKYPGGLIRVGKAPKTLLAYRSDKPFKKVRPKTYEDIFGDHHAVEILGDGQQYVAYAEHPDILKPYMWHGDGNGAPPGIFEVESNSLTIFNLEDARAVVSLFEEIATEKVRHTRLHGRGRGEEFPLNGLL